MSTDIPARNIRIKRTYQPAEDTDGTRILVDRLWPRGVTKAEAGLDEWITEIAPSAGLRSWFGHDPARWAEFRRRYREELLDHPAAVAKLRRQAHEHPITLVYSAKDTMHNHAIVLRNALLRRPIK